jgi:hypothetical protein
MKFKVEKSTASKNGGFVVTLRSENVVDKITKLYSKGLKRFSKSEIDHKIGTELDINLDHFEERRDEGEYLDPETGEERKYTNVWIFYKGA